MSAVNDPVALMEKGRTLFDVVVAEGSVRILPTVRAGADISHQM